MFTGDVMSTTFNFSYKIKHINKQLGELSVLYVPEDSNLTNHISRFTVDFSKVTTPTHLDNFIMKRAPLEFWSSQQSIANVNLDVFDDLIGIDFLGKSITISDKQTAIPKTELEILSQMSLDEYKKFKKQLINQYRNEANALPIKYDNNLFDSDLTARTNIQTVLSFTEEIPDGYEWRTYDNVGVSVTKADLQSIHNLIANRLYHNHATAVSLKTQIDQAEDKESVDLIDINIF